jgi:ABC-2 type transport system permease protein
MGEIFPLTHFIRAARSATLQGGTTWDVLGYGVPIIAFPVAAFALGPVENRGFPRSRRP